MEADGEKHFSSILRRFSPSVSNGEGIKVSVDEDDISAAIKTSDDCPPSTFLYDGITNINESSPKAIYKSDVMKLVKSVLHGYNGTLVSLGLESTDHFSFLLGSPNGLLYEAAGHILSCIRKLKQKGMSKNLTVQCSYVLIANEKVHDLLQDFVEDNPAGKDFPLDPFQSTPAAVDNHVITISDSKVKGCKTIEAKKVKDVAGMLRHGSKSKDAILLGMPDCGVYHCSFAISIEYSKFGSMFAPMSGTFTTAVLIVPDQIDINTLGEHTNTDAKSIVALKKIVDFRTSTSSSVSGSSDVLYSESLLTQLLQAAFGGNCKTLFMTHVPDIVVSTKSVQTCSIMELASLARNIQNKPDKTELAEKALMDAYLKEMRRQMQNENPKTDGDEETVARETSHQEDEVMIAQALASAANEGFEEDSEAESDEDETTGKCRHKKISLKPKTKAKRRSIQPSHFSSDEIPEDDMTVESLVVLIQNPDNGVPRASQRDLINVQIHRGKGSVFSGAAIVTWFLENIDGVNSIEDAEQLGQILLDRGAIFHSDGSSCFLNAENLFYYARHPLTSGKLLSVDEIRALLASVKESNKREPTMQVTIVPEQSLEEPAVITGNGLDNNLSCQQQQDSIAALLNQNTNVTTESKPQQNESQEELVSEALPLVTSTAQQDLTSANIENTPASTTQTEVIIDGNIATEETDSGDKETKSASQAKEREIVDQPNVNDLQDIDLVVLERSTNYPHPLHFASAIGKPSGVIEQLIKWYGVDCLDERKRTPLMFAALGNKGSVCRILIDCGSILDKREANGLTAIHTACYHGSKDALKVLLSKGANTAIIDRMFRSSYHWSTVPDSSACLEALLKHSSKKPVGFNDLVDKYGLTPLHWAIFYKHPEHLKLIVKRCPNLLKLDTKGRTLMTYAISEHRPQCVEVLTTSQALINAPDRSGLAPLHHAAVEESSFYVAYLLNTIEAQSISCINAKDAEGRSPLHYATLYQRHQNVQLLLQFGADSSVTDNEGNKPLDLARRYQRVDERITKLIEGGPESEIDVNLILTNTQSQYLNHTQSKACIIL